MSWNPRSWNRRQFLKGTAGGSLTLLGADLGWSWTTTITDDYGVASGDPRSDGFVIWTRLPDASTLGRDVVGLRWQISDRGDFPATHIVAQGELSTSAADDYTVRVSVEGLEPYKTYFYRFIAEDGWQSVCGRSRTAPSPDMTLPQVRFATISCQDYTVGFYSALANLAQDDDLDFVVHLGDHIYETGNAIFQRGAVRKDLIGGDSAKTLADYRAKYRLYLSDPALREVRRLFPMIHMWDDHEVFNNYAGPDLDTAGRKRQRSAYQAFYEYMPIGSPAEKAPSLVRRIDYGRLLALYATDQRQFRNGPVCGLDMFSFGCSAMHHENRTMLGHAQRDWLAQSLTAEQARWKVLLSQVMFMPWKLINFRGLSLAPPPSDFEALAHGMAMLSGAQALPEGAGLMLNLDAWDGYPAERRFLTELIHRQRIDNVVIATGDIHNFYAGEVHLDPDDVKSPRVATEMVTGSVTSNGLAELSRLNLNTWGRRILSYANPHLRAMDLRWHGYMRWTVTAEGITCAMVAVDTVKDVAAKTRVLQRLAVPTNDARIIT